MTLQTSTADKPRFSVFGPAPRAFSDWLLARPALPRVATAVCVLAMLLGVALPFDRVLQVGAGAALLLFTLVAFIYLAQRLSFSLRAETGARFVDAPKRGALLALVAAIFAPVFLFAAVSEARNYLVFRSFPSDVLATVEAVNSSTGHYLDRSDFCADPDAPSCLPDSLEEIQALRREAVRRQHALITAFLDQATDSPRLDPYAAWVLQGQVWQRVAAARPALERAMQVRDAWLATKEQQENATAGGAIPYDADSVPFPPPDGDYAYDVACDYLSASFCAMRDLGAQYGAFFVDPDYDTLWPTWAEAEALYIVLILASAVVTLFFLALQFAITLRVARLSENGTLYAVYSLYIIGAAFFTAVLAANAMGEYIYWEGVWSAIFAIAAGWIVPSLAIGAIGPLRREPWGGYLERQAIVAMPGAVLAIITFIAALTMRTLVYADPQTAGAVLLSNALARFAIGAVVFAMVTWFSWGWLDRRLIEGNCRPRRLA